jgi:hypothetical protein
MRWRSDSQGRGCDILLLWNRGTYDRFSLNVNIKRKITILYLAHFCS